MSARASKVGMSTGVVVRRLGVMGMMVGLIAVVGLGAFGAIQSRGGDSGDVESGMLATPRHETVTRRPVPPAGASAGLDVRGQPVAIACMVCHSTRSPNRANATGEDLDEFHQGLQIVHGGLTCLSCHNADDYGSLHLSGGARVEFTNVQALCAQCHAKTVNSYEHGAHGGMTGYWDLTRGGRVRNGCLDCHDPHAPAFPQMTPTFKPIDRFLQEDGHG